MTLPPLLHAERVASPSLAGYLYQTIGIALLWLDLQGDEVLVCEGNEDADRHLLGKSGRATESTEIQFKLHEGNVSVRDAEVRGSVFGFIRSFRAHAREGRNVRFVFTTSASAARQRLERGTPPLCVDVLHTWMNLITSARRAEDEEGLVESLQILAMATRPAAYEAHTKAQRDFVELEEAVRFLDQDPTRWRQFMSRVDWQLGQGGIRDLRGKLEQRLKEDPRTRSLPARLMEQRLVSLVLETSSEREPHLRELTKATLSQVVTTTEEELRTWADSNRFVAVWDQLSAIEERVARLEEQPWDELSRIASRARATLARFAVLRMGEREVRIERDLLPVLVAMVATGHLLLTGEPGSGKSGLLHALAGELEARGLAVLTFEADDPVMLNGTLVDRLGVKTDAPLVILVDALDSVRNSEQRRLLTTLRQLVERTPAWTVVATVRTFDLVHGHAFRRLFAGNPPADRVDPRLGNVRHVRLDDLSDGEFAQVENAMPELASVVRGAPDDLRVLLRNPFYLSLAGQLVTRDVMREAMRVVRTRIELLNLFWEERVADLASGKEVREAVVHHVCGSMIDAGRLSCNKCDVNDTATMAELLSMNILREPSFDSDVPDDRVVMFAHHILFDYAVSRVWLPKDPAKLAELIAAQPRLLVFVRPSLEMLFADVWVRDRSRRRFWQATLHISANESVREIGKILGPSVAAKEARSLDDLQPLLAALERDADGADVSLAHVVGALEREPVAGAHVGPWSIFAEAISRMDRCHYANRLLQRLTSDLSSLTAEQLAWSGRAARNVLRFALNRQDAQSLLRHAIRFVCKTAESDRADVVDVLSKAIAPDRLQREGYETAPALCGEIEHLFGDPKFVASVYVAMFAAPDMSSEPTRLGGGVVLSLSSNRRQDYQGALYSLAQAFPAFLRLSPVDATDAMFRIAEGYELRTRRVGTSPSTISVSVNAEPISILLDASDLEDDYRHDEELDLLRVWENQIAEWALAPGSLGFVKELFALTLEDCRTSAIWRRWLRQGNRAPSVVGVLVAPLLEDVEIYRCPGLSYDAIACMRSVFPFLDANARGRIERALLDLVVDLEERPGLHRLGASLGGLDPAYLTTLEAKQAHARVSAAGVSTENEPSFRIYRTEAHGIEDPDDWLRRARVPIDNEPNRSILRSARALAATRTAAEADVTANAQGLLHAALALESNLEQCSQALAAEVSDVAWEELTKSLLPLCAVGDEYVRAQVARVALKAAGSPCPRCTLRDEKSFAKFPSWSSPHVRGEAAQVLGELAERAPTPDMLEALRQLADDDSSSVRYRTYFALTTVSRKAPAAVARIVEHAVANDRNPGTLGPLVAGPLGALAGGDAPWAIRLLGRLLNRKSPTTIPRRQVVALLVDVWAVAEDRTAGQLLAAMTLSPWSEDTHQITLFLRQLIQVQPPPARSDRAEQLRHRASQLMAYLAIPAHHHLELARSHANDQPQQDLARLHGSARLVDCCSREIHHASGAFENKKGNGTTDSEAMALFLSSMAPVIEILADAGVGPAAHHLLETLEYLMPSDPHLVLRLVANTVLAARASEYQFDHLAAKLVVRIVTTILAEHRSMLADDEDALAAVLDVIDVFVRVGWPEAYEITYGLQHVFR